MAVCIHVNGTFKACSLLSGGMAAHHKHCLDTGHLGWNDKHEEGKGCRALWTLWGILEHYITFWVTLCHIVVIFDYIFSSSSWFLLLSCFFFFKLVFLNQLKTDYCGLGRMRRCLKRMFFLPEILHVLWGQGEEFLSLSLELNWELPVRYWVSSSKGRGGMDSSPLHRDMEFASSVQRPGGRWSKSN